MNHSHRNAPAHSDIERSFTYLIQRRPICPGQSRQMTSLTTSRMWRTPSRSIRYILPLSQYLLMLETPKKGGLKERFVLCGQEHNCGKSLLFTLSVSTERDANFGWLVGWEVWLDRIPLSLVCGRVPTPSTANTYDGNQRKYAVQARVEEGPWWPTAPGSLLFY